MRGDDDPMGSHATKYSYIAIVCHFGIHAVYTVSSSHLHLLALPAYPHVSLSGRVASFSRTLLLFCLVGIGDLVGDVMIECDHPVCKH